MDIDEFTVAGTEIVKQADGKPVLKLSEEFAEVIRGSLDDAAMMNEVGAVFEQLIEHHDEPHGTKFAKLVDHNEKDFMPGLQLLARLYIEPAAPAGGKRHRKTRRNHRKGGKSRKH